MDDRDARVGLDVDDDDEEEGVYENEPERRDDVVREADKDTSVDLPAAGTASNMKARFLQGVESATSPSPRSKREITPPAHGTGGEYVSEPRTVLERYEAKPDAGVFESPEPTRNPEVVSSYEMAEEARPEQGYTRNVAARFKDLEAQSSSPSSAPRREITPPNRDGPAEYVSEPRGPGIEQYDVKVDAGVFESEPQVNPDVVHSGEAAEEALPERGTARNMASRYLQLTEESKSPPAAKAPKEIVVTSEADTRVEYESEPQRNPDVVTSDTQVSA
ncbi:LIM domain and actin-binding protein 1 [Plakobranchus ocellatus]|uniref:LIM domain and actin-binding protein 1 n=1 Tax=Plakobranchus ocellatus TaxID=259542 RepID=A0AAV4ABF3_9GAST|nr:LIM domain and actin-binding protein 1 [Plakobranchus ocellatus]